MELLDGLRPDAGDVHDLDERRRDLCTQPVVVGHPARRRELEDLVADRGTYPGDAWRLACPVGGDEVDRAATDGVGRPVVGDGLEAELAVDLEHVADVMEDPRQVAVRQAPVGGLAFFLVVEWDRLRVLVGTEQFVASWHVGDGSRPRASRPRSRPPPPGRGPPASPGTGLDPPRRRACRSAGRGHSRRRRRLRR